MSSRSLINDKKLLKDWLLRDLTIEQIRKEQHLNITTGRLSIRAKKALDQFLRENHTAIVELIDGSTLNEGDDA